LDRDTDERLSKSEALDFLNKIFSMIDNAKSSSGTSVDCKVDVDEVVELLNLLEVPWDYQLAVKMVLDQELTLISHLMKNLVERADKDKDDKVEIEEILAFDDFEFVKLAYNVFAELGNPGERLSYLTGGRCWGGCGREESDALVATWLTALQNMMTHQTFLEAGKATDSC